MVKSRRNSEPARSRRLVLVNETARIVSAELQPIVLQSVEPCELPISPQNMSRKVTKLLGRQPLRSRVIAKPGVPYKKGQLIRENKVCQKLEK